MGLEGLVVVLKALQDPGELALCVLCQLIFVANVFDLL